MKFFDFLPDHIRNEKLKYLKGRFVLAFPAAHAMRIMGNRRLLWENASTLQNGFCYKTAPQDLIDKAIKYFQKNNLEFHLYTMEGEIIC